MNSIIVPPQGMPYPLAFKLIGDGAFAHKWLCHAGGEECPDGCDCGADPEREKLYSGIRCYFTERDVRAYRRGARDAERNRPRIFRQVGSQIVADCGDNDDHMADEWDDDMRQAYMDGYDSYDPCGC